jgi:hypothetical protein
MALASAAGVGGHFHSATVDAYAAVVEAREPALPGMGKVSRRLVVSVKSTDSLAMAFAVDCRLALTNGSIMALRRIVQASGEYGVYATARFGLGEAEPVSVISLDVTRLHQEVTEHLER